MLELLKILGTITILIGLPLLYMCLELSKLKKDKG